MKKISLYIKYIILIISSLILTAVLIFASINTNKLYYERWPLKGDTASYLMRDISLLNTTSTPLDSKTIWSAVKSNNRDPLRTFFYTFLDPKYILSINGHLFLTGFSVFLFFITLSICIFSRTNSIYYAISGPILTLLPAGLLDPMYGVPSRLPDMPAAFLLGSALFVLFFNQKKYTLVNIFLSGTLLGLATLCRYHVWIYGLFILMPIIAIKGLHIANDVKNFLKEILKRSIVFTLGLMFIAGYFIIINAPEVFHFYSIAGYGLNKTLLAALQTTGMKLFVYVLGSQALVVYALVVISYFSIGWVNRIKNPLDNFAVLWAAFSCPVLVLIGMRVEDDITQTYYMMPGIFILCISPFILSLQDDQCSYRKIFNKYFLGITIVLPFFLIFNYFLFIKSENFLYPRPKDQVLYDFNKRLANAVNNNLPLDQGKSIVIDANFDYYWRYVIPELLMRFNRLTKQANLFQIRESQWQISSSYPENLSSDVKFSSKIDRDKKLIMPALADKVDIFIALTQFDTPESIEALKDSYTREMAAFVADNLKKDRDTWEFVERVASPYGGDVLIYLNKKRRTSY